VVSFLKVKKKGSPLYMAPEVLKGEKYNSKADLWSLSAILYEMFEGKPPFKALNVLQLIKTIETATIDYSGIPSKTAVDLMKKLFVLNPEKRLSFDEFYNHPYIQEILLEKEPLKPISQKSPKHPKTSPFKKEDFDTKMVDDFLVIESKPALLASLLSSGTSGYVIYPTTIFDFSTSNYEKENEEQV
jgi:serine/threonine protein kinase